MRTTFATLALPALAAITAACTPMQWQKEGASEADLSRDLVDCRRIADFRTPPPPPPAHQAILDKSGKVVLIPIHDMAESQRATEVYLREQDCMRDRGYELVKVPGGKP